MSEIKEIVETIKQVNHKFTEERDTWHNEREALGKASAEQTEKIERISKHLDDLDVKLQRTTLPSFDGEKLAHGDTEEGKARKAAFFKWMRHGKASLEPQERKALVEDATGLYLVPEDLETEILRAIPQYNVMRRLCGVRNTIRDKVKIRSLTEVSVGWGKIETGTDIPESTVTPSTDTIYVEDLYGLTKLGEDELMDTDANLAAMVANSFAIALANAEEKAFVIGDGHTYSEPEGICTDAVYTADAGNGKTAGYDGTYGSNWSIDDTVALEDMLQCEYDLGTQYLNGAVWLMNRKTELAARVLRAEVASGFYGNFLWQPSLMVGQPASFDGFPIYNNNNMAYPADTTAAVNVIFGNLKNAYLILDRSGMSLQRLDELYAEAGLVGFKVHKRVGGGMIRYAALHLIHNDT